MAREKKPARESGSPGNIVFTWWRHGYRSIKRHAADESA